MSNHYVVCTRAVRKGVFIPEPGATKYLVVPDNVDPVPQHAVGRAAWTREVRRAATWDGSYERGDIVILIHGYNVTQADMMARHKLLDSELHGIGFKGLVVSFDWPSNDSALNYAEDRHDARQTAMRLVTDGIRVLAREQQPDCMINVHLLAHSTGAFVIREAFDDADDARLTNNAWMVSQIALIAGDISSQSLSNEDPTSRSLYRHCVRLTNYSNLHDSVLKLSNAKRVGMAPRVGRIGLPPDHDLRGVNVDCSAYFYELENDPAIRNADQAESTGTFCHSWHIGNKVFIQDLFETLKGDIDRHAIATRARGPDNGLELKRSVKA